MKKIKLIICFLMLSNCVFAQNWEPEVIPLKAQQIRAMLTDTINDKLYVAGMITYFEQGGSINDGVIGVYDGNSWSYIDTINDVITSMVMFNDELYIAGFFSLINNESFYTIAKWDGSQWHEIDVDSRIIRLRVIGDYLYAMGNFSEIGGIEANKVARFDGNQWQSLDFPELNPGPYLIDIARYNDEYYAGGNYTFAPFEDKVGNLTVYRDGGWQKVGEHDRLWGGFTNVAIMEVYKDNLYVGGPINKGEGNVAQGIQMWDGERWFSIGDLQLQPGLLSNTRVTDMFVHDDRLFVLGNFHFVDSLPAKNIATWDGERWCSFPGTIWFSSLLGPVMSMYRDTLYVASSDTFNGVYTNKLVRWVGGDYVGDCTDIITPTPMETSSNEEISQKQTGIQIFPNPTQSHISISLPESLPEVGISIYDATGREVYRRENFTYDSKIQLDVSGFIPGVYFVNLNSSEKRYYTSFVVKE
ncbi:MAG: T9SS C-terminal target domain-containing protein [Chitinophagaceae bacterium]|nr:MAG: T9SS C-terminal target domain-containing protein [Chitinophagaceae bacterium]